jgi:hypothetical protein
LCLQTPECINLGAEVAATLDEADDEVFLADCCSVTDLDAIPAGPDGSPDMKVMCEDAKSSAMSVGRGWQRAVLASAAVQLLLAMKFWANVNVAGQNNIMMLVFGVILFTTI